MFAATLASRDKQLEETQALHDEALKQLEAKHKEKLERTKGKYRRKLNAMMAQTKDALDELQNEKEQLAVRLKTERKFTMMELRKHMNKEPLISAQDLERLREDLAKKDKDIEYLTVANRELKHVWKDTAKMLKTVLKQLSVETRRIEEASRRNDNY